MQRLRLVDVLGSKLSKRARALLAKSTRPSLVLTVSHRNMTRDGSLCKLRLSFMNLCSLFRALGDPRASARCSQLSICEVPKTKLQAGVIFCALIPKEDDWLG